MAIFCGIIVLFLERSSSSEYMGDRVEFYLPACIGCAVGNYLGNNSNDILASTIIFITICYVVVVLRPFGKLW